MDDTQFYQRILGLEEPWQVKAVRMDVGKQTVEVEVAVKAGPGPERGAAGR